MAENDEEFCTDTNDFFAPGSCHSKSAGGLYKKCVFLIQFALRISSCFFLIQPAARPMIG